MCVHWAVCVGGRCRRMFEASRNIDLVSVSGPGGQCPLSQWLCLHTDKCPESQNTEQPEVIVDKWHRVDKCYTQLLPAAIAAIKTSTRSKHRARTADSSVAWIVLSGDRHGWYTLHYCESRNKLRVSWSGRLSSSELSIRVQNSQSEHGGDNHVDFPLVFSEPEGVF